MNLRSLFLSAPLAVVLACGGSSSSGTGSDALNAATPSFGALSLDQIAADTSAPTTALVAEPGSTQMMGPGGVCHPHLFLREREVVERVNRHIYKVLGKIEKLIATKPVDETTRSKTWAKTESGVDISFTIELTGINEYSWTLAAGATGAPKLPVVMTGVIDRANATGPHQGQGSMEVDFALLHAAFPNEKVAQGTLHVDFNVSAAARKINVLADAVAWDIDPSHFDGGMIPTGLAQPRSGAYVYFREPGKGGSLKIQDEMVFGCSMDQRTANATLVPANAQMISRWFKAGDGTIHGRSDGLITGGSLAQGISIVGVTCHNASAEQHMPSEGFWLVKAEDASSTPPGATLFGFSSTSVSDPTGAAAPCDAAFLGVPVLTDASKDFAGWPAPVPSSPINPFYSDNTPYPFPGM